MINLGDLSIEDSTTMDTTFLYDKIDWNEKIKQVDTKESLERLKKYIGRLT